jgi:small subunit ribosomal protein S8
MVNDPVGDLLAQIKNASMARLRVIELPHSRMKASVAKILSQEGYIGDVETVGDAPKQMLRIGIKYQGDEPVITGLKRMSKPGLRSYVGRHAIPVVVGGMGIAIVSTPSGVMTGRDAKKKGIGGELLCTIW